MKKLLLEIVFVFLLPVLCFSQTAIFVNQVGFDSRGPKIAVVRFDAKNTSKLVFSLIDAASSKVVFTGTLSTPMKVDDWFPGKFFHRADFSSFRKTGNYKILISAGGGQTVSE